MNKKVATVNVMSGLEATLTSSHGLHHGIP